MSAERVPDNTAGRHRYQPRRPRPSDLARRWKAAHGQQHWPTVPRAQTRNGATA